MYVNMTESQVRRFISIISRDEVFIQYPIYLLGWIDFHSLDSMSAEWDYAETDSTKMSLSLTFTRCLKNLPVNLEDFVKLSKTNPDVLFNEQTLDRIVQIVLVEQDTRISNKVLN